MTLHAAVEAGGTKFVVALGVSGTSQVLARATFPTGDAPAATLAAVIQWLQDQALRHGPFSRLGIASFGPIDLNPKSPTYGFITTTPKLAWQQTDLLTPFHQAFGSIPIGFDTDTNAAALGEFYYGATQNHPNSVYITIGTGIGIGVLVNGRPLHGLLHPEGGHQRLARDVADLFPGVCPFHGDCWEGLASGPAVLARTGIPADLLPADHPSWPILLRTTARALHNLILVLSPTRIILGGSLRKGGGRGSAAFFHGLRQELHQSLAGYIDVPELSLAGLETYLQPPLFGDDAGIVGAGVLAEQASAF
ncbi:MAG: ROK family protein [Gemmataceae bacterium]